MEQRVMATLGVQEEEFTVYGDVLEQVEVFKYLGCCLSMTDDDVPAVRAQLVKACRVWVHLSTVLRGENALPKVCGIFYRAVVQSVLLYGRESWELHPELLL